MYGPYYYPAAGSMYKLQLYYLGTAVRYAVPVLVYFLEQAACVLCTAVPWYYSSTILLSTILCIEIS